MKTKKLTPRNAAPVQRENTDLITNGCIAGTRAAHATGNVIRKSDGREVAALRFHHQANHRRGRDMQKSR